MHQAESDSYRILVAKIFPEPPKWKTFDILPEGTCGRIVTIDPDTLDTRLIYWGNDEDGFEIELAGDFQAPPEGLLWVSVEEYRTLINL